MKKFCLLAVLGLVPVINCSAECYESGSVFDDRGGYSEGTLCRVGDDEGPVLPYYQQRSRSHMDYLFSDKEEMAMLKSLVNRGRYGSENVLNRAMINGSRPLRPYRNRELLGLGF